MSPDWKTHTVWIYPITLKYCFIKARTAKFTSAQAITAPPLLIASTNLCIESNSPITNVLYVCFPDSHFYNRGHSHSTYVRGGRTR